MFDRRCVAASRRAESTNRNHRVFWTSKDTGGANPVRFGRPRGRFNRTVGFLGEVGSQTIEAIAGVFRVEVNLGCCDHAGKGTLTVGIVEKGSPVMAFRAVPVLPVRLPTEIIGTYRRCMDAWERAVRIGDNQDNVEEGHSLMANSEVRAIQLRLIPLAWKHFGVLRRVLRDSAFGEHRAAAAWVLGYAPDKASVTSDLVYASGDPDALVRNNAMRSLWAIASLSTSKPELDIHIPGDPFIDLLNSIVSTDRNKALAVLSEITGNRPPNIMAELRGRALPVLAQMARKADGFSAYLLIARMAGLAEKRIAESWKSEERETVILRTLRGASQE